MTADTLLARALKSAESSIYLARIGFEVGDVTGATARARLEHRVANANRAGAVHGGAIASALLATGELAAAASERNAGAELATSTAAISFLEAVRGAEVVEAMASVLRRGRDTIHVTAEARSPGGQALASALLAYRVVASQADAVPMQRGRAADAFSSEAGALAGSAYMGACGARILERNGDWSGMSLPLAANEGVRGRVHDGG